VALDETTFGYSVGWRVKVALDETTFGYAVG